MLLLYLPVLEAWAEDKKVLVFGDSLSAGYGLQAGEGWVSLLAARTEAAGLPVALVNASISGETTRGGLRRLGDVLARQEPDVVILELGGNDGLRGYPIEQIHSNLREMVKAIKATGAEVLLVSIPLPPNYGPRYVKAFQGAFEAVAAAEEVPLLPFTRSLLPLNEDMMQADGIHPTAKAQPLMLEALWPALAPLLDSGVGKAMSLETPEAATLE
jgi:acyl-CoA thioesterase-1